MKYTFLLFWCISFLSCSKLDSSEPEGNTSYEKALPPEISLFKTGKITARSVQVHLNVKSQDKRSLDTLIFYTRNLNVAIETSLNKYIYLISDNTQEIDTTLTLYAIAPNSPYELQLYVANRDTSVSSFIQAFKTKPAPSLSAWSAVMPYPGKANSSHISCTLKGMAYVGLGCDMDGLSNEVANDFWSYDPLSNSWQQKADFPGSAREGATPFVINDRIYVAGGHYFEKDGTPVFLKDLHVYIQEEDRWERKKDLPFTSGICNAYGASIREKGYLFGGSFLDSFDDNTFMWEYDPLSDSWTRKAECVGFDHVRYASFVLQDKFYVVSGYRMSYSADRRGWCYDVVKDKWTQIADLPEPRDDLSGFSIRNRGYVVGGRVKDDLLYTGDMWIYLPEDDRWIITEQAMEYFNWGSSINFVINGRAYINSSLKYNVWSYDSLLEQNQYN